MKKTIYLLIVSLLFVAAVMAQAPQKFSYQAVIRNSSGALVTSTQVGMFISITKDSANGSVIFAEIQRPTTNANGLVSIAIGTGTPASGSFSNIKWGSGTYYIKTSTDLGGGSNYAIYGASQLLSVPYALYAANGNQNGNNVGDMQYWDGSKWVIIPVGTNGSTLTLCGGVPTWGGCAVAATVPTVTTTNVTTVASTTAIAGGNITSDGGATVTSRGVCYATTVNPTVSNSTVSSGNGTGSYSANLTGLTAGTTYYVRAYATNSVGTAYGGQISFTTTAGTSSFTIGQNYGGGIIFYIDASGQHGLVAATTDQSTAVAWWNGSYLVTGASDTAVGTGQANTTAIIAVQASGTYAANVCVQTANGYSDWFMPSKGELALMYKNLHTKGFGNFTGSFYYSSSEYDVNQAWVFDFGQNSQFAYYKNNTARVRAVRKF
ncbi:DUF1566 domain-containing protein [Parasediminibacterium sp. JCM 36343]|uniref:Lcl domain-containing protein n=1 Tax=Parasediminibacterium sp. JCM 36343 TaxID=3374279 RepID=UPI00397948E1